MHAVIRNTCKARHATAVIFKILTPQSADFATKTEASPEVLTRRPGTLALVVIVLITGWAFLPVLQNGFVDESLLVPINNFAYRGFGRSELRWMFAGFHFG